VIPTPEPNLQLRPTHTPDQAGPEAIPTLVKEVEEIHMPKLLKVVQAITTLMPKRVGKMNKLVMSYSRDSLLLRNLRQRGNMGMKDVRWRRISMRMRRLRGLNRR
jgi:hypothetical protein